MSTPVVDCTTEGFRVRISIDVVDENDNVVSDVKYNSPRGPYGFIIPAMLADITVLAGSWAKGLTAHCPGDADDIIKSVSGEAAD